MKPIRAMQTAGLLKSLLDLAFWAIVVLAPVYVLLVVVGYERTGDPDMALGVDVWFNPTPVAWALEGDGSRAARIVHGTGAVRFQRLPWPDLAVLLAASMLRLLLWLPVLQQLRRLLGALSIGRPFVRENADRLRKLGWALILVELALAALRMAEGLYVAWQFRRPGLELWPFRLDCPSAPSSSGPSCWSPPRRSGAAPSSKRSRPSPSEEPPCRSSAASTACCWSGR